MSLRLISLGFILTLFSCKGREKNVSVLQTIPADTTAFFPLAEYLAGQINEVHNMPLNPLYIQRINGKAMDSNYVSHDKIDSILAPFIIKSWSDTIIKNNYDQARFYDQSIPAVTLSYDQKRDGIAQHNLKSWTVYIHPVSEKIENVLLRKEDGNTVEQLTWEPKKMAKSVKMNLVDKQIEETILLWDLSATP